MERKKITQEIIERVGRVQKSAYVALNNPILEKTRLDAVLEMQEFAQSNTMDTEEKLDFIASKISNRIEELKALLPEDCRIKTNEFMGHLLWRLQNKLVEKGLPDELSRVVEKIRSFDDATTSKWGGNLFIQYEDFADMRGNYHKMNEISKMITILQMEKSLYSSDYFFSFNMQELLESVESKLNNTAKFWKKWKPIVEKVEEDISLEKVLSNMAASDARMKKYDSLYEKLLPEVFAKHCVTDFEAVHEFERVVSKMNDDLKYALVWYLF